MTVLHDHKAIAGWSMHMPIDIGRYIMAARPAWVSKVVASVSTLVAVSVTTHSL